MEPLCEETSVAEVMNTGLHHLMLGFKQVRRGLASYAVIKYLMNSHQDLAVFN